MTKLVIIDVDQTLITGESFKRFVVAEIIGKRPLCAFGVSKSYLLRRLGIISIESFKESCLASLKGRSRAELEAMGDNFSETWLSTKIRDGGKTVVDSIRQQGNCGILISGSIDIYIKPLAEQLGFEHFVATQLAYDNLNNFSGRFLNGDCLGERRIDSIKTLARSHGFDLKEATFYGDNISDLDLMHLVGEPIGVWPDRELRKHCIQNGWPIEHW